MKTDPSLTQAEDMLRWHEDMDLRPVPLYGKQPFSKNFGLPHRRTWKPEDFLRKGKLLNIGWQMGPPSGGLCDIDMDTDDPALIAKAVSIYSEIGPFVFGKDTETPSHIMFRVEGRPADHMHARIEAQVPGDERHAFDWRLGGYNGNRDRDGTEMVHQIQTFTTGEHPGTGLPLVWHSKLSKSEDIPTVSWEKAVELFTRLCLETGAEIAIGDVDCSAEPGIARHVRETSPKSELPDFFDIPQAAGGCSGQEIITLEDQAADAWPEIAPQFLPWETFPPRKRKFGR